MEIAIKKNVCVTLLPPARVIGSPPYAQYHVVKGHLKKNNNCLGLEYCMIITHCVQ